jgi:hypothetical protein
VKQSDLGEYELNAREKKRYKYTRQDTNSPSNQAIRTVNTNSPPQISKARSIKGFGEDIGQMSLCVYASSQYLLFQRDLSGSGVSSQGVSFFCGRLGFWLLIWHWSHMRGTLSKLTPKSLMMCTIHRIWEQQLAPATYSASVVDWKYYF